MFLLISLPSIASRSAINTINIQMLNHRPWIHLNTNFFALDVRKKSISQVSHTQNRREVLVNMLMSTSRHDRLCLCTLLIFSELQTEAVNVLMWKNSASRFIKKKKKILFQSDPSDPFQPGKLEWMVYKTCSLFTSLYVKEEEEQQKQPRTAATWNLLQPLVL